MSSIYDIPIDDIELFLLGNNKTIPESDDLSYKEARKLMKTPKLLFYPPSILEWMVAYNLLKTNVKIDNYTENYILKMPQAELNELAKLLTIQSNNRYTVLKILQYMHKI